MIAQPELYGMPEPAPLREGTGAWAKHELSRFEQISIAEGGLLPAADAADVLGLSRQRVHQLLTKGQLHSIKVLGRSYISVQELQTFMGTIRPSGVHVKSRAA